MKKVFYFLVLCVAVFASGDYKKLEQKCFDGCKNSCLKVANYYQHDADDVQKSITFYKILCAKSVWSSCKILGDIYYTLDDINMSKFYKQKALNYAQKGCKNGSGNACFDLGTYTNNNKYYKKALKFYKKECDKDDFYSCYMLGNMHFEGIATKRNYDYAIKLYEKSCKNDEPYSCYNLARLYKDGVYVKKDMSLYENYCKKANSLDKTLDCN